MIIRLPLILVDVFLQAEAIITVIVLFSKHACTVFTSTIKGSTLPGALNTLHWSVAYE